MQILSLFTGSLLVSLAAAGCVKKVEAGSADAANSDEGRACPASGMIGDGEANNNQVTVSEGRGGYWYTFVDKAGSTVAPKAGEQGGVFEMAPGGANGSKFAARMQGTVGQGGTVFAGMGFNFTDPKGGYDASKYRGFSFFAKKGAGGGSVRVKVPDSNTDPDGKVCTECYNDFGTDLELTSEWQKYTIPFSKLRQMPGWGKPVLGEIKPQEIYGIQFQVNAPGMSYDIWVDDVAFTGCR